MVVALLGSLSSTSARAGAPPEPDLPKSVRATIEKARVALSRQEFEQVIATIRPTLTDTGLPPVLADVSQGMHLLEWIGASYWFVDKLDDARIRFAQLIRRWPDHKLDRLTYPHELIDFYDRQRQYLKDLGMLNANVGGSDLSGPAVIKVRHVTVRETPWVAYFSPFGVGQFANDDTAKGITVATAQGLGIAATIIGWVGIQQLKFEGTKKIDQSLQDDVDLLNGVWIGGVTLLTTAYLYSVIDGFVNQPSSRIEREYHEPLDPGNEPAPLDAAPRLRLSPGPGQVGAGLHLDF